MSDLWSDAIAVPAWTRALPGEAFRPVAITRAADFSPWGTSEPATLEPDVPAIDVQAIHAQAFSEGFEQGRRTVEMEIAAERAAVRALAEGLETLRPEAPDALAVLLADTVSRLVGGIVGKAEIDRDTLLDHTRAAAQLIAEECAPARLRLAPDDADRLAGADLDVELVADPAIRPGLIVMETAAGWIEDGPQVRLEKLRQALDGMGVRA